MKIKKPATPNFDRINPAECVNAKMRKLHRKLSSAYESKLRPFGLQGSMLAILFVIGKMHSINQKALAEKLVLDKSTMSRDIKKLAEKGWVKTERGEDPRNTMLQLTNEGYLLLEKVTPVWEKQHRKVTALLGSFSIQQLDNIMQAITANFEDIKT